MILMENSSVITKELIEFLRNHFRLEWKGIHGAPHWARVRQNGLMIASETKANTTIVELFAFMHDAERKDDGVDIDHGWRAAQLVKSLHGDYFRLSPNELDLLLRACEGHSDGHIYDDPTVMTCWDADRLDLGRVGIKPIEDKLCTDIAKQKTMIDWAYSRSIKGM